MISLVLLRPVSPFRCENHPRIDGQGAVVENELAGRFAALKRKQFVRHPCKRPLLRDGCPARFGVAPQAVVIAAAIEIDKRGAVDLLPVRPVLGRELDLVAAPMHAVRLPDDDGRLRRLMARQQDAERCRAIVFPAGLDPPHASLRPGPAVYIEVVVFDRVTIIVFADYAPVRKDKCGIHDLFGCAFLLAGVAYVAADLVNGDIIEVLRGKTEVVGVLRDRAGGHLRVVGRGHVEVKPRLALPQYVVERRAKEERLRWLADEGHFH